jgi:hypothetical protein
MYVHALNEVADAARRKSHAGSVRPAMAQPAPVLTVFQPT